MLGSLQAVPTVLAARVFDDHGMPLPGKRHFSLTIPGSRAMTRLSPLDGKNFNRVFPGSATGTTCPSCSPPWVPSAPRAPVLASRRVGRRTAPGARRQRPPLR